jgi:hypothetical protein
MTAFRCLRSLQILSGTLDGEAVTRRVTTNAAKPEGLRGPMGQFANAREYPSPAFKDVTAPNADTLYSSARLDLSQGPGYCNSRTNTGATI